MEEGRRGGEGGEGGRREEGRAEEEIGLAMLTNKGSKSTCCINDYIAVTSSILISYCHALLRSCH